MTNKERNELDKYHKECLDQKEIVVLAIRRLQKLEGKFYLALNSLLDISKSGSSS